jgi:hypothetical protein
MLSIPGGEWPIVGSKSEGRCMQVLVAVGLGLNIIGVVLLFIWGPPQPDMGGGVARGLENKTPMGDGRTVGDIEEEQRRTLRRHKVLSRIGLGFVGIGFACQFAALWV